MEENIQNALQQRILGLMIQGELSACFKICITRPTGDLSASEKQCLAMCQDRYQDVFQKTFFKQYEAFMKNLQGMNNE